MKETITLKPQPFCIQPSPNLIIACRDSITAENNVLAVSFATNASIDEPMVIVGIVPERYSYHMIKASGCFSVNIPTKSMKDYFYYVGSVSGAAINKLMDIPSEECDTINCFYLSECPVALECEVVDSIRPGSHELFIARVNSIHCKKEYLSDHNEILWNQIELI